MNTTLSAKVTRTDAGGFVAVASTASVDRDGEVILPGAFNPLPASLPVHINHTANVRDLVARARPYYEGGRLMIEARFASTSAAQDARTLVTEGILRRQEGAAGRRPHHRLRRTPSRRPGHHPVQPGCPRDEQPLIPRTRCHRTNGVG